MSEDSEAEERAYAAINIVARLLWPKQRERILKNIVERIMIHMGWTEVKLIPQEEKKDGKL